MTGISTVAAVSQAEAAPILIVDDQRPNLEALEATLAPTGCRIVGAESADDALRALLHDDFAAIVLDIRMPGVDGLELAELIKRRRRTQSVPILFLTAHLPNEDELVRGYRIGAVDYLIKPVNPDILRSKIAVFVDLFRKTQALARANDALQHEVQARERAQDELRRSNLDLELRVAERTAALQEADRRKDEFLATLSHELRTPLNAIYGWSRMLRSGQLDPVTVPKAMEVIERNAQIQTQLIGDLLDVSRIVTGKLHLQATPVDLAHVVNEAVDSVRMLAHSRSIEVLASLGSVPLVSGDGDRLQQVVWNLLSNAIKFTLPGGRVWVLLEQAGEQAVLTYAIPAAAFDRPAAVRLRAFPAGRQLHHARPFRARHRPDHRQASGRSARRPGHRRQRGRGPRRAVRGAPAAGAHRVPGLAARRRHGRRMAR